MPRSCASCCGWAACLNRCTCRTSRHGLCAGCWWQLVAARTKLCNVVRGLLRQEVLRLPGHALLSRVGWERLLDQGFEHWHLAVIVAAYLETLDRKSTRLNSSHL